MHKLIIIAVVVAILSGCATAQKYSVARGGEPDIFWGSNRWKNNVQEELAEDGREWNKGWPAPKVGNCIIRRLKSSKFLGNPPPDMHQHKIDINCEVWDATKGPERKLTEFF